MDDNLSEIRKYLSHTEASQRIVGLVLIGNSRIQSLKQDVIILLQGDKNEDVRATAAWTLDLLSDPETIPDLVSAMYDKSFGVRSNAGWALVHIGRRILPNLVVPDVIDVLKDETDNDARQMAYMVLTRIGGQLAHQAIKLYWK